MDKAPGLLRYLLEQNQVRLERQRARIAHGEARLILFEFDMLEESRDFIATHLASNVRTLEEQHAEMLRYAETHHPNQVSLLESELFDRMHAATVAIPRAQWYAQLMGVYSAFEHRLNQLCNIVQLRSSLPFAASDLAGQGVRRSSDYLKKLGVDTPFTTEAWRTAELLNKLRNSVAHRDGQVDADLARRAAALPGVQLTEPDPADGIVELVLDGSFVAMAITTLKQVLTDIADFPLYAKNPAGNP